MSVVIPTPPPGSWIEAGRDEQGRPLLSWREPFTWPGYLVGCAFGLVPLGFVGYWTFRLLAYTFARWADVLAGNWPGGGGAPGVLGVIGLVVLTAVGVAAVLAECWTVYAFLRATEPERLALGDSGLRHESRGFF